MSPFETRKFSAMTDDANRSAPFLAANGARDVELTATDATVPAMNGEGPAPDADVRRKNIKAMFAFQLFISLAWGTAMGPIFDKYLYLLGSGLARGPMLFPVNRANSLVGVAESVSGITSLIAAIPVGYVVDRRPDQRAHLLRLSTGIALLAVICGIVVVATDEMIVVFAMLICFGLFMELASSASEAIFADSIPAGERAALFVTKSVISTVGAACGPGIAAVGLALLGDKWEPYQIKIIMVLGLLLMLPTILPLFIFHDPKLSPVANGVNGASPESRQSTEDAESAQSSPISRARLKCLNSKHVPFILALSDFITCIGAGMTVKFFNLFFIQDEHFSPVAISLLQTAYPLVIAGFMKITERLAKPLGRPQASLTFFSLNVLCLLLMAEVRWLPALLLVFLVRGGMANSTYPIDRSILMDFTPSSQRGMWNAVSSLTSMTWSGSAFLGGVLSDARDYRYTFLITALVYASACLVYLPLLYLVPRKEKEAANASVS